MRVLLTGALGFVGPFLLRHFLNEGHEVTIVRRLEGTEVPAGVRVISGDLGQTDLDLNNIEVIVHAAGTAMVSGATPAQIINDNLDSTRRLYHGAVQAGVEKFIFLSSMSVYGKVFVPSVNEDTPVTAPGLYGSAKYLAELFLEESQDNMSKLVIRLPAVLCPSVWGHWLSFVLKSAQENKEIAAYNPGNRFNNAIDVDDLSVFVSGLLARELPSFSRVVLAAGGAMMVREVIEKLLAAVGSQSRVSYATSGSGFVIDASKAARDFSFSPRTIGQAIHRYGIGEYARES
jgi:nucleoside-diphosphate-sugar epimerase